MDLSSGVALEGCPRDSVMLEGGKVSIALEGL
jgi:hypothetical protein